MDNPFTLTDAGVTIELPEHLRDLVADLATSVASAASDPASPAYARVCSPIDPTVDDDDPLARLERQSGIDATCALVRDSAFLELITTDVAEAWLRVLTLASGALAHVMGVFTEDDRAALDPLAEATFSVLTYLQCMIVFALDPEIEAASQEAYDLERAFNPEAFED